MKAVEEDGRPDTPPVHPSWTPEALALPIPGTGAGRVHGSGPAKRDARLFGRGTPRWLGCGLGSVSTGSPKLVGLMRILQEEQPQLVQKRPGR